MENLSEQTTPTLKITRTVEAILRDRQSLSHGASVFTRGAVTKYYNILEEASERVGVSYGRKVIGGFVTHDLRHTEVTRMLQTHHDLATIGSATVSASRPSSANNFSISAPLQILFRSGSLLTVS